MPALHLVTRLEAPIAVCFDLARDVDVHLVLSEGSDERVVAGVAHGTMALDDQVTFEARHLGVRWRMTSQITALDQPNSFIDDMLKGPFGSWHHLHTFTQDGDATLMVDDIDFRSPMGPLGWMVDRLFLGRFMERMLTTRNERLAALAAASTAG